MILLRPNRARLPFLLGLFAILASAVWVAASPADPAAAASGAGYVRLAHLSPDTPAVDVYLSSITGAIQEKTFPGVAYGMVSDYQRLPTGTYGVAMRLAGADRSGPPVLTTQVVVADGSAYTVAGVGRNAGLGLRVIEDDITLPSNGKAKLRVVQASVRAPMLDVQVADGAMVAAGVPFASTTSYQQVDPGLYALRIQPSGSGTGTTVTTTLSAGNVYSLLVLDAPTSGYTGRLLVDARRQGGVPLGAVETGGGGLAGPAATLARDWWRAVGALALLALLGAGIARLVRVPRS
jgi:Domain of unknown function (DUF4397)